jgi:hypothetical protein
METLQAQQIHMLILALHVWYTAMLCENTTKEDWIPTPQMWWKCGEGYTRSWSNNVQEDAVEPEVTMYREMQ